MSTKNDPTAALVDFTAFMFLVSVVMFIVSEDAAIGEVGTPADVFAITVTAKSPKSVSFSLLEDKSSERVETDIELSVWAAHSNESEFRPIGKSVGDFAVSRAGNQVSLFAVLDEVAPRYVAFSISHIETLERIDDTIIFAIDVFAGRRSCAAEWTSVLGSTPGYVVDRESC